MNNKLQALERAKTEHSIIKQGFPEQEYIKTLDEIENELKELNEILALHDKWLGNEISDFEFFTLLVEIRDKYGLLKEVLL